MDKIGRILIELNDDKLDEILMTSCVLAKSESDLSSGKAYARKVLSNGYLKLFMIADQNRPLWTINDSIDEILYAIE